MPLNWSSSLLKNVVQAGGFYSEEWYGASFFHVRQSNEETGPQMSHWCMEDPFWFFLCKGFHSIYSAIKSTYHTAYSFYDQEKNTSTNLWTRRWCSRLGMFDIRSLLAVHCSAFSVMVKSSYIFLDNVRSDVISDRPFETGKIVRYYYPTSVYFILPWQKKARTMYGDDVMTVTVNYFFT